MIADCDDLFNGKHRHEVLDEALADQKLACERHPVRERIALPERVKRKCIPEQRKRLEIPNRSPHHRRTRFGRPLLAGRGFAVAAMLAQMAAGAAEHEGLAGECDAC